MNHYVLRYLYLSREFKKIVSISDCLSVSWEIGIYVGFLFKDEDLNKKSLDRIYSKYMDLSIKVHNKAIEIHNEG